MIRVKPKAYLKSYHLTSNVFKMEVEVWYVTILEKTIEFDSREAATEWCQEIGVEITEEPRCGAV